MSTKVKLTNKRVDFTIATSMVEGKSNTGIVIETIKVDDYRGLLLAAIKQVPQGGYKDLDEMIARKELRDIVKECAEMEEKDVKGEVMEFTTQAQLTMLQDIVQPSKAGWTSADDGIIDFLTEIRDLKF